jgi:hypothetical protein
MIILAPVLVSQEGIFSSFLLLLVKQKITESHFPFQSFAVVGAPLRDATILFSCGEVYVFELIGESWSFSQFLGSCKSFFSFVKFKHLILFFIIFSFVFQVTTRNAGDNFGFSVGIDGDKSDFFHFF